MVEIPSEHIPNLAAALLLVIEDVYQECVASQRRRDVADASPLAVERVRLSGEQKAVEHLHFLGRTVASRAEVAGGHSLAAILRLLRHPDDVGPTTSALYPLARSAIEGATIAHYLQDADISLDQRLLRTAQILVWSEQNRLTFARDNDTVNVATNTTTDFAADAEVEWARLGGLLQSASITMAGNGNKPWQRLARGDESVGRFEILRLTHRIDADTSLLYRALSGVAHHAPWITEMYTRFTFADKNGAYFGTQVPQSEQVNLVAAACHALMAAATMKARFYGAPTDDIENLAGKSHDFFTSLITTLVEFETQN